MEIVLAALADAIMALLIEDLAQRPRLSQLREKLRGDSPEKLALQHALAKSYRTFAGQYPQIAHAFLDEQFLGKAAVAAELATLLTPDRFPDASALIQLWRAQFQPAPVIDVNAEVDFFLTTLASEIKSQPALKPFTDSRAFEQLYTIAERSATQIAAQQTANEHLSQIHAELVALVAILREKLPGIQINQINTDGGSIIVGNVETQHFTGRDHSTGSDLSNVNHSTAQAGYSLVNPFTDRGRINDPNRFFVRQPIVRELQQELAAGNSIVLIGEPGVGKSSLLKYLQLTHATWLPDYEIIYLDLYSIFSEIDFCNEVIHIIMPLHNIKLRNTNEALIALKHTIRGRNLLLMLDEVERMADRDFTSRLHGLLRALIQDGNLILLAASKLPIQKVFPPSDPTSPLHNVFNDKRINYFSKQEMDRFIHQRLEDTPIQFTAIELSEIWQKSEGHPDKMLRTAEALFRYKIGD